MLDNKAQRSNEMKRYDIEYDGCERCSASMKERSDGDYVLFKDHQDAIETLSAQLAEAKQLWCESNDIATYHAKRAAAAEAKLR